jgi:hypothetical protein
LRDIEKVCYSSQLVTKNQSISLKGLQNTSLADAVLWKQAEILIDAHVNSGFSLLSRLASSAFGCFAQVFSLC